MLSILTVLDSMHKTQEHSCYPYACMSAVEEGRAHTGFEEGDCKKISNDDLETQINKNLCKNNLPTRGRSCLQPLQASIASDLGQQNSKAQDTCTPPPSYLRFIQTKVYDAKECTQIVKNLDTETSRQFPTFPLTGTVTQERPPLPPDNLKSGWKDEI